MEDKSPKDSDSRESHFRDSHFADSRFTDAECEELVLELAALAERAGEAILEVYQGDFQVKHKEDASPVTEADERAEAIILDGLSKLTPHIPVVAEEAVSKGRVPDVSGGRFFLVDPLDGTREFIKRNGEFTVNIGLIEHGKPTLGVVYLPALRCGYLGTASAGAWRRRHCEVDTPIRCRPMPPRVVVIASRSHRDPDTEAFMSTLDVAEILGAGSSLKFCRVAEGIADVYPRFGRTMEWDIAAGHAVLVAAGGSVRLPDGDPMPYAKADFANGPFIARGQDQRAP